MLAYFSFFNVGIMQKSVQKARCNQQVLSTASLGSCKTHGGGGGLLEPTSSWAPFLEFFFYAFRMIFDASGRPTLVVSRRAPGAELFLGSSLGPIFYVFDDFYELLMLFRVCGLTIFDCFSKQNGIMYFNDPSLDAPKLIDFGLF